MSGSAAPCHADVCTHGNRWWSCTCRLLHRSVRQLRDTATSGGAHTWLCITRERRAALSLSSPSLALSSRCSCWRAATQAGRPEAMKALSVPCGGGTHWVNDTWQWGTWPQRRRAHLPTTCGDMCTW